MQETQVQFSDWEDPLEKEMQPTPVFLPGKSRGQRRPGGLQSMGLQTVRHDLATEHACKISYNSLNSLIAGVLNCLSDKLKTSVSFGLTNKIIIVILCWCMLPLNFSYFL